MKLRRDTYRPRGDEVQTLDTASVTAKNYWLSHAIFDKIRDLDSAHWNDANDYADLIEMIEEMMRINHIEPSSITQLKEFKKNENGGYTKLIFSE